MPAPPPNQQLLLQRVIGRELIVLLGPEDGTSPTEEDEAPYLRVIEVFRSASGRSLDYCRLEFDFALAGFGLENIKTPTKWKRQIEVRIADSEGRPRGGLLFWGELTKQSIELASGESCILTATVQSYHFGPESIGGVLLRYKVLKNQRGEDDDATIDVNTGDIAFNPIVDDEVRFNMGGENDEELGYPLHVDVDSLALPEGGWSTSALEWKLTSVIAFLLASCNPTENFITNPVPDYDNSDDDGNPQLPPLENDKDIRNLILPLGESLPSYLDAVLLPLGYSWCIDYGVKQEEPEEEGQEPPPPERVLTIRFFSRETGPEKELYLQAKGERYDRALTNLSSAQIEWDIANLANYIVGVMAPPEYQVTIELQKTWPESLDSKVGEDLDRDNPDSDYYKTSNGEIAWRRWAANENDQYRYARSPSSETPQLNLNTVFVDSKYIRKRRKMEDLLYFDAGGFRKRPVLEYRNPEYDEEASLGDPGFNEWLPVPVEWGYVVLEDQIGVLFTGNKPPEELIALGDDARLRLTGTLTGDVATEKVAGTINTSPNGRRVVLRVDLRDKFKISFPQEGGPHDNEISTPYGYPSSPNSETLAQQYIDKILQREKSAAVSASIELFGLHYNYQIGDVLTKIAGRNISLDRNSEEADTPAYLQVMGIRWMPQDQKTELITSPTEVTF